ncbi:MAG TPA: O-antigen ligase family protein [Bdellovibrionota bacterium]|nr:O-antigen ligase family protein [Bdellovibrionota bacterium]
MLQKFSEVRPLLLATAILGMFPSFTALSQSLYAEWPFLGRYAGPINPLKLASPLIFIWLWSRWADLPVRLRTVLLTGLVLGTLGTITGGLGCNPVPPALVREWAVLVLGVAAVMSVFLCGKRGLFAVLIGWTGIVYGSVLLNFISPEVLTWVNTHLFDPLRKIPPRGDLQFLMGFYDVASLGKLLMWLPWVLGFALWQRWPEQRVRIAFGFFPFAILSTVLSLWTTQRGPFIGMLAGWFAFFGHLWWISRRKRVLAVAIAVFASILAGVLLISPKDLISKRVSPLFSSSAKLEGVGPAPGGAPTAAHASVLQRKRLYELNLSEVAKHPLGHACTPKEEYEKRGIIDPSHTHSLILEQFKARGWLWGLFHLALWLIALVQTWRVRSLAASALIGGICATLVMGLADHPWFVLNHAMILAFFLFAWVFMDRDKMQSWT